MGRPKVLRSILSERIVGIDEPGWVT